MENFQYSSYPNNSRKPQNYRVKLMCSYGGKIQQKPDDKQLTYTGGNTKILVVERNIKFSALLKKLLESVRRETGICIKYQLPGEDLDTLISVINDEDVRHMLTEYDRLYRASGNETSLRLFLYRLNPLAFASNRVKSEPRLLVDVSDSVQEQNIESSSHPVTAAMPLSIPDVLVASDKKLPAVLGTRLLSPKVVEVAEKDVSAKLDSRSKDQLVVKDSAAVNHQLQELQVSATTRKQKIVPVPAPVPMGVPALYLHHERHATTTSHLITAARTEPSMYQIQMLASTPVTIQISQGTYGIQVVVQEMCRDQLLAGFNTGKPATAALMQQQQLAME